MRHKRHPPTPLNSKRRVAHIETVENEPLGSDWYYKIDRWQMTTGASEYGLEIYLVNNVGVQEGSWVHFYGELGHAHAGIEPLWAKARSAVAN